MTNDPETLPACINGGELGCTPATPLAALVSFYRAFNARDMLAMERVWLNDADATMDNPIGGIRRGWPAIREGYDKLFNGPAHVYVEFHDYTLHGDDRFVLAVGRERGYFENASTRVDLHIRTSRLFVNANGTWRQMHHHGSIEDGALLERYQALVLGAPVRMAP